MANEVSITSVLRVRKLSGTTVLLDYLRSASYSANLTGTKGPTPGAIAVPVGGVAVSLAELTTPGWCWIHNLDATNEVHIGPRDPDSALFYPMLKFGPGERYLVRLSDDLFEEYQGTGTGTGSPANQLWARALDPTTKAAATAALSVEAFEA